MNLLGALAKVGSLTMVSRILGFVRDTIIARAFGAGMATDAFFVAFKLPNLLRRVFAEGAFAQAFVPILAEYKETRSPEATQAFVRHVAGMLSFCVGHRYRAGHTRRVVGDLCFRARFCQRSR